MKSIPHRAALAILAALLPLRLSVAVAEEVSDSSTILESDITKYDRQHWSLLPIERPQLPHCVHSSWAQEPLDVFILEGLESAGLQPADAAPDSVLLRRLMFDVVGLPPTPGELRYFLADESPVAYEQQVDRWLSAPAYGERWAQFWLDLARFAETDGFEHDKIRKGTWRYRDWVINALNDDMPYDQFLRLQLTGDQQPDERAAIATVFCTAGPDMPDINEQDLRRHDKLNELTSTVGSAPLGLQFQCAQCHDHKYDPISQADFFRLRAVFDSSIGLLKRDQPVLTLKDSSDAPASRLYHRGDLRFPGPGLKPGLPRLAVAKGQDYLCLTENPRAEFCDWLVHPSNPLTARVIVNRLWQFHFGQSLCENPSDFGLIAGEPTHPELLDWLAAELHRKQWSIKQLHRTILLSATYRQQGRHAVLRDLTEGERATSHQDLYHGFPIKRLEGEVLRDAMLYVSGRLNRTMGAESVMPPLPPEMLSTLLKGQWKTSPRESDHVRRSIYTFARRNLRYPMFDVFDRPDAGASCAIRDRSTTSIQSLHLLNGDMTIECARHLSDQFLPALQSSPDARSEVIDELFVRTLGRKASSDEQVWLNEHFETSKSTLRAAMLEVCVAVFNTNEFLYVD